MKIAAWISAAIAVIMIILGAINFTLINPLFGVTHSYKFFYVATTFLLLAIFCRMMISDCCNKEKK
jgi:hypothetical protein